MKRNKKKLKSVASGDTHSVVSAGPLDFKQPMGAKVTALAALAAYYVPVISLGTWRSDRRGRSRKKLPGPHRDGNGEAAKADGNYSISLRLFLANREVPLLLALCSMTAAWGGGGYLCGTAEAVFKNGLLSVQAPLGYAISLLLGGRFFSHKMRSTRSVTMLDPLQQLYGRWMGPLLCVPALFGELFWTAAALAALGDSAEVIGDLNGTACIVACLLLTMSYTTMGGLNSVVQTDAVQLCATIIGLWICVPFCITNDASGIIDVSETTADRLTFPDVTRLVDNFLSFVCGGIPRQVYFQRVLSSSSLFNAKMFSYISAIGCLLLAVPPIIIGTVSRTANFTEAGYPGTFNLEPEDEARVLPLAMHYLCPTLVSALGMSAIVGAVMSTVDSSTLSASTLIARNVYQTVYKPTAPDRAVALALRCALCLTGALAAGLALSVRSVFKLWTLSTDMVYVLLFPQLLCAFYLPECTNSYGSFTGFLLGGLSLALCGQPDLGVRPLLRLPLYHEKYGQRFPFRTLCMLLSFGTLVLGSVLAKFVFSRTWLSEQYDVFYCFHQAGVMDQLKPSVQPIESRGGARFAPSAAFLPAGAAPTSDISVHSSNVSDASSRTNMLLAIERVALSVVSPQKTAHKKDFSTNDVRLTNRPSAALSQRALDITGETTEQRKNAAPYQRVCKNAVEDDCKTGEPDTTPPAATNTNSTVPPRPDDASPPAVFEATHPDAKGHHVATVRDRTLSDADITLDGNSLLPHYTHTERFSICPQSPHDGSPFHQGLAEHQAYYPSAHNDDLQNDADPPIGIDSLRGVDYVRNPTSTTDSVSRPSDASNAATGASSPAVAAKTEIVGSDNTGPAESIPEFCKDAGSSAVKIKNPVRHRVSGGTEAAEKPGRETSPVAELSSSSSVTSERTSPGRSPSTKRRRHDRSGSGSDAPGSVDDKSAAASDPACHDIVSKTSNGALHNSGLSGSSSTPQEADKATETSQGKKKRSPTARRVAARSRAAGSSSISSLFDEHSTSSTVTTEQSPIRRPRSAKGIKRSKTKGKHQ